MPIASAVSHQFLSAISAAGAVTQAQPAFTDISGNIATSQVNSGTNASSATFFRGDGTWNAATTITAPPTTQTFTSGSAQTYNKDYTFVISSGSATVGATYTNNAVTFTVYATVASATQVVMSGSGAPASSGTLTKATGTGDATLTFSQVIAPLYLKVTAVGGGAGGLGSGTSGGTTNATAGGNTTFGSSLITANGGALGTAQGSGGAGGSASVASPALKIYAVQGGDAMGGGAAPTTSYRFSGGNGGNAPLFGGGGALSVFNAAGNAAIVNTGGGGQGGGNNAATNVVAGPGGGAGGLAVGIVPNPSATYTYSVGTAGVAGAAGVSGLAGGAGAAGVIVVEEHYQ